MHDEPSPTPLPELLVAMRREASVLQGVQSTMVILGAMPVVVGFLSELDVSVSWPLNRLADNAGCAFWLVIPEGLLWAWWAHEVHHALCSMRLASSREAPEWLWCGAVIPPLGALWRWVGMGTLTRLSDPDRLLPVSVPVEQEGGFREGPVRWVAASSPRRPRLLLWRVLWSLMALPLILFLLVAMFAMSFVSMPSAVAVPFVLPMLVARMLVSGVTANVEELGRRYQQQTVTGGRRGGGDP